MGNKHIGIIKYIECTNDYDVYQELFNTLIDFCELSHLKKPTAEIVLEVYADLVMGRRKKDAE